MAANEAASIPSGSVPGPVRASTPGRLAAIAIVAGILAGAVAVVVGERILDQYREDLLPKIEIHPGAENVRRWHEARLHSAALNFATAGGWVVSGDDSQFLLSLSWRE